MSEVIKVNNVIKIEDLFNQTVDNFLQLLRDKGASEEEVNQVKERFDCIGGVHEQVEMLEYGSYLHTDQIKKKYDIKNTDFSELLDSDGGGEGGGEDCYIVVKPCGDGKIYRLNYSYYSYHGCDYDDCKFYEVKPVERMVTFYE